MIRSRRKLLHVLLQFSDIAILIVSLVLTDWVVRKSFDLGTFTRLLHSRVLWIEPIALLGAVTLWHYIFKAFQLYESRRFSEEVRERGDIVKAITLSVLILVGPVLILSRSLVNVRFFLFFSALSILLTVTVRRLLRMTLSWFRLHDRNLRYLVIVGTNRRAFEFSRMIQNHRELGYRIVGHVDTVIFENDEGARFLGGPEEFSGILKTHVVDEVIIALPIKSQYEMIRGLVRTAQEHGIIVRHRYRLFESGPSKTNSNPLLEQGPVSTIGVTPHAGWQFEVKRLIDVAGSLTLLVLASPVMLAIAVALKLTTSAPVVYSQERVGYNKRLFRMYKFRTMVPDAELLQAELEGSNEMEGPVFKIENDPRVTPLGRFLRKKSLDELPQFFNVLKGEMSLVGPRPLPIRDYKGFDTDALCRRFSVKPGITCTWQTGGRNEVPFDVWMKMDMQYIDGWSLLVDLKILLKTIPAVLRGTGSS